MASVILGSKKVEELYVQDVFEGYDFEHEREEYSFIEEESSEMDDDGKNITYIYQRKSDGKYFSITITFVRYGYESYSFESWANDGEMFEVVKREKVTTTWEAV